MGPAGGTVVIRVLGLRLLLVSCCFFLLSLEADFDILV